MMELWIGCAAADRQAATALSEMLRAIGFEPSVNPWDADEDTRFGERGGIEEEPFAALILLSQHTMVQPAKLSSPAEAAVDFWTKRQAENRVDVVPVLLERVAPPDSLTRLHVVSLGPQGGFTHLAKWLHALAKQRGRLSEDAQLDDDFVSWLEIAPLLEEDLAAALGDLSEPARSRIRSVYMEGARTSRLGDYVEPRDQAMKDVRTQFREAFLRRNSQRLEEAKLAGNLAFERERVAKGDFDKRSSLNELNRRLEQAIDAANRAGRTDIAKALGDLFDRVNQRA